MSSTRHNQNGEFRPEAGLSHPAVRGYAIGAQVVARVARAVDAAHRSAMLWLAQFAHLLDLTADLLSDELELDPKVIRAALTEYDADRSAFTPAVQRFRARFEAGLEVSRFERRQIPPFKSRVFREAYARLADTKVRRKVANAVKFAETEDFAQMVEVVGETRLGKTVSAAQEFFRRLDHAAWLVVPSACDEVAFLRAVATALGCSVANTDKSRHLLGKIEATIGPRGIRTLFVDESHRLFPPNLNVRPKRLDYLRDWWEFHGLSVVLLATPQFTVQLNAALASDAIPWETGQWIGRVQVFDLPGALDDHDLREIALNHAPEADPATLAQLITHAKSSRGYAGAMVKAIERARSRPKGLNLENVIAAQTQNDREARRQILAEGKDGKGGKGKGRA